MTRLPFPGPLPPHNGTDTSVAAAESMRSKAATLRAQVLDYVESCAACGTTCDHAEVALDLSHQTCSARINELAKRGLIVDSGRRAPTRSGRKAVVWVLPRWEEVADGR